MRASAGVNFDTISFELRLARLLIFAFCALVNPSHASAASRLLATRKWGMKRLVEANLNGAPYS